MTTQYTRETALPTAVYSARWLREMEAQAAREQGTTLFTLMVRAGQAAFNVLQHAFADARHLLVLVGHGNNGGDGYIVATLAKRAGWQVTLLACEQRTPLPDEARRARSGWLNAGGVIHPPTHAWPAETEVIVDALLGSGLHGAAREPYNSLIQKVNQSGLPVVSLDIPSGLDAQTGSVSGEAIRAQHCVTFIALKPGLLTGQARDYVGQLHCADLGLARWLQDYPPLLQRADSRMLPQWIAPRRPCTHKGEQGRLLIIGGDLHTAGAVMLAGEAALRAGAGLVRILTRAENRVPLLARRPELMVQSLTVAALEEGLAWADALVIGPGLGQGEFGQLAVAHAAAYEKPMLWDADALNLLANQPAKRQNRILTPHPGEAARLLQCRTGDIECDRFSAAQALAERYGGVCVLKGAGTLIASSRGELSLADVGNAGMATAGMGDVLSGIIGALLAQRLPLFAAACAGGVIHGAAADEQARRCGERGLIASDLFSVLHRYVNPERLTEHYDNNE